MFPLIKRFFDFLFSLIGILLAAPIMAVAIVVLRFTGEGKVFFVQERVGFKNRIFKILKFTTMLSAAPEQKNNTNIGKRDPRITPIGAFFRNSKIDELPQMINVLKGDMSFVGPRPLMKNPDFNSYPPEVQKVIYNVRPGITAIGSVVFRDEAALITQVKELGKDPGEFKQKVIFPYKGQLEVWYNENQSFWVDFKILLLTAWTLIFPTSQLAFKAFNDLPERGELLKLELNRMQQLKESVTLLGMVVAVLIPIIPSTLWFWDNLQFIMMAAIPVLGFAYLLYQDKQMPVKILSADVGWFVFLGLGFLSFFWAINPSLIWYQGFGWLSLVLWMLLFRTLAVRQTAITIMPLLFLLFFLVLTMHHLVALFFNVQIDENWNHFFGKNAKYTSTFLVCFYPYLLFFKSKYRIVLFLQLFFTAGIFLILYITNAQWAIVSLLLIGIYYLWNHQPRKDFYSILGVLASFLFFIVTLSFFNPKLVASLPGVKTIADLSISYKYYLFHNSWLTFLDNPFVGIGLGNWHLDAYKTVVNDIPAFNNPNIFSRYRSHNLYSRHFAELGIIGGLAFLYPIVTVILKGWSKTMKDKYFHQAAYASLMVYLITSFFYNDVNFYEFNFSSIQLLAFCALGILTSEFSSDITLAKWMKVGFLLLALTSLVWFVSAKLDNDFYWKTKQLIRKEKTEESIQALEKLYHPVFKTTHGFKDKYSHNRSLPFELAVLYQEQEAYSKAQFYYEKALALAPNDENILLTYAQFLYRIKGDSINAKKYALKIYSIQQNHYETNLLLAKIAMEEGQLTEARDYLDGIQNKFNHGIDKRLEELYQQLSKLE